jgi:hypothetical protein
MQTMPQQKCHASFGEFIQTVAYKIFPSCPYGDHDHLLPSRSDYEDTSSFGYSSTLKMEVPPNSCNLLQNHTASHPRRYRLKNHKSYNYKLNINKSRSGNDEMLASYWPTTPAVRSGPGGGMKRMFLPSVFCGIYIFFLHSVIFQKTIFCKRPLS